jgi:hypothetical protein
MEDGVCKLLPIFLLMAIAVLSLPAVRQVVRECAGIRMGRILDIMRCGLSRRVPVGLARMP